VGGRIYIADHLFGRCLLLIARAEDLGAVDGADDVFSEVGSVNLEEDL